MKWDQIGEIWKQVKRSCSQWKTDNDGAVRCDKLMSATPASADAPNDEHPVFSFSEKRSRGGDFSQHINS
jgi:hypothetical protein